jgi:hypothetical protein
VWERHRQDVIPPFHGMSTTEFPNPTQEWEVPHMGTKERVFTPVPAVSLDELVPVEHFYLMHNMHILALGADPDRG